jgi:hypothetical protein
MRQANAVLLLKSFVEPTEILIDMRPRMPPPQKLRIRNVMMRFLERKDGWERVTEKSRLEPGAGLIVINRFGNFNIAPGYDYPE